VRVYHYFGPTPVMGGQRRLDGAAWFAFLNAQKIPGVDAHWFWCEGDPGLHGKRDLNVEVDWAEDVLGYGEFTPPRPRVYWCSDTHMSDESRDYRHAKAKRADKVFCSIWSDVEAFKKIGVEATWLPYAAEHHLFRPRPDVKERYDVGFFGSVVHGTQDERRMNFLDAYFRYFDSFNVNSGVFHEDLVEHMAECRVLINHCLVSATNLRVFEVLLMGKLLVTPETEDLNDLGLRDGEHLATYRTLEEAVEKTRHYVAHPEERVRVAEAGRKVALERHTYFDRTLSLLGVTLPPDLYRQTKDLSPLHARSERKEQRFAHLALRA